MLSSVYFALVTFLDLLRGAALQTKKKLYLSLTPFYLGHTSQRFYMPIIEKKHASLSFHAAANRNALEFMNSMKMEFIQQVE